MKITWLGQAGLLFEGNGLKIMIDPYLSDSCGEKNPKSKRRVKVDESFFDIKPDVIILTHDHLDHTDEQTLSKFLTENSDILVLASKNAWNHVRAVFGGNNNYVMFNRGTKWTEGDVVFEAVRAEHSDDFAIGVIINDGKRKYYVTGDTLYNEEIFKDIPNDIYALFLPINGLGNNMNCKDAEFFAKRINSKYSIPLHVGLFDSMAPDIFKAENRVLPEFFKEIEI